MVRAIPNSQTKEVRFVLDVEEGKPLVCTAPYGIIAQMASALGSAATILRTFLAGSAVKVAAEPLHEVHIEKDLLSNDVLVRVRTVAGIPYTFQIRPQDAVRIADRLRTEAQAERPMGSA